MLTYSCLFTHVNVTVLIYMCSCGKYESDSKSTNPELLSNHLPSQPGKSDVANQHCSMLISYSYQIICHRCLVANSGCGVS